jgi:hypothetical protein
MLKITHNAGFFSCCNMRLHKIIDYFNDNKKLPRIVDSSAQFLLYKPRHMLYNDITNDFFIDDSVTNITYEKKITITHDKSEDQFSNYKLLHIEDIKPFITKYFIPSQEIVEIKNILIQKYNIQCDNCIAVYYRGTDKYKETKLGDFSKYSEIIEKIKQNNLRCDYTLLIQSDCAIFLNYMKQKYDKLVIIKENKSSPLNEGIHLNKENIGSQNYNDMKILFATFLIICKCRHFVCSSSNCSLWMMYYRGNTENIYQYLINDFI